jgi:hypothetical protein
VGLGILNWTTDIDLFNPEMNHMNSVVKQLI